MKYRQFIDAMRQVAEPFPNAKNIFEEWQADLPPEEWKEKQTLDITAELVQSFIDDMADFFRAIIGVAIQSDQPHEHLIKEGHTFLRAVHDRCQNIGIEMKDIATDVPLTLNGEGILAAESLIAMAV